MIRPINGYILIEPLKHESFIPQDKGTYEEIGVVIESGAVNTVRTGNKVYFDSWLAAKFPKNDKEFYWLVNIADIKAVDDGE